MLQKGDLPKQSSRWFGGNKKQNLTYSFLFYSRAWEGSFADSPNTVPTRFLICCCVDASNLDVFNEFEGLTKTDYDELIRKQGYGRYGLNPYPEPVQKESFFDGGENVEQTIQLRKEGLK
jgi:hypothetical protein